MMNDGRPDGGPVLQRGDLPSKKQESTSEEHMHYEDTGQAAQRQEPPSKKNAVRKNDAYEELSKLATDTVRKARLTSLLLIFITIVWLGGIIAFGIYAFLFQFVWAEEFLSLGLTTQIMLAILALLPLTVLWLIGYYVRQAQSMFFQAETMRIQAAILTDPSNDALQRIQQVAKALFSQMTNLGQVNKKASQDLEHAIEAINTRTTYLERTSLDTSTILRSTATDLQTAGEYIDRIMMQMNAKSKSVEEMIALADSTLRKGGEDMAGWQERYKDTIGISENAAKEIARMQDALKSQVLALEEASVGVTAQSEKHLVTFKTDTMSILDSVGGVARSVLEEAKSLQDEMRMSAENLHETAQAMKASNHDIITSSEEKSTQILLAAEDADKQIADMEERMRKGFLQIETQIESVTDRLESVLKVLSNEDSPINGELRKFLTGVEQVTQRFTTQAANLVSASHVAAERSETINEQLDEQRRDVFLKAARYLLNDMHSTSLDLTRTLGGEITDQELKRFMNGDSSIFTQSLVSRNLGKLEREIIEKLEVSKEARDYAIRFMQQFERLLDDSRQVDPERILQASFVTSDIGKLYMVLCRASGRRPNRQLTSIAGKSSSSSS